MKNFQPSNRTHSDKNQYTQNPGALKCAFFAFALLLALSLAGCAHKGSPQAIEDLKEGQDAFNQSNYDNAISFASQALARDNSTDTRANAYYLIGRSLESRPKASRDQSMKDLRDAWINYTQALKENPSDPLAANIRTSLGNVAYWLEDFTVADQQWAIAYNLMEESDTRQWVLYRRGLCNQRLGYWDQADKIFTAVKENAPDSQAAQRAATKLGARAFYVQVGAFEKDPAANTLATRLRASGLPSLISQSGNLYRVFVGPYSKYPDAVKAQGKLPADIKDPIIVP